MEELNNWKGVGFRFGLQQTEDGYLQVKVIDPWYPTSRPGLKPIDTLEIKLCPYTSFTEAQEIVNFINRRRENGNLPLLRVQGEENAHA